MQKFGRFLIWTAIIVGMLVGLARATALRWWQVPVGDPYLDASIAPSLRGGDTIILWRLSKPKFGDLVMCPEPKRPDRVVIGRIAGEGGDMVKVKGQNLEVNGRRAETETACAPSTFRVLHPATKQEIEQNCSVEAVAGVSHMRGGTSGHGVLPASVDQRVPDGKVFLLSDNRLLPYDSRDFGVVDRDDCTETVVFRLWSQNGWADAEARMVFVH